MKSFKSFFLGDEGIEIVFHQSLKRQKFPSRQIHFRITLLNCLGGLSFLLIYTKEFCIQHKDWDAEVLNDSLISICLHYYLGLLTSTFCSHCSTLKLSDVECPCFLLFKTFSWFLTVHRMTCSVFLTLFLPMPTPSTLSLHSK